MMDAPDRLELLLNQTLVTGIDFIFVHDDQVTLDVYFHVSPLALDMPLDADLTVDQITIYSPSGGESLPEVPVSTLSWETGADGRDILRLTTEMPGDFSLYRLRILDTRVDRYYNDVLFSFKADCPSDLDCDPDDPDCPPEDIVDFPVDYTARDFWSFRRALLDFASLRYPDWPDRLEADVGVMLVELMSALGDDLAYYQDRIAREAYLETATQRRSLRHHARLVDYTVHDGSGATTWLEITVESGGSGSIPAGTDVWAITDDNKQIIYEVGNGLADVVGGVTFAVDAARNELPAHVWDEDDTCLPVGSTVLFVKGHHAADLPLDDLPDDGSPAGRWVLLRTTPADPAIPERRWLVCLIAVQDVTDPLIDDPVTGHAITRLEWEPDQTTPYEMDLRALTVRGNMIPATAGRTVEAEFAIGPSPDPAAFPEAIERTGPNGTVAYRFSLAETEADPLVWLGTDSRAASPEVRLVELELQLGLWQEDREWFWRRSLVGDDRDSSHPYDPHFALEDGIWRRVVGYWRTEKEIVHTDYASANGKTVRFGDGEFGLIPAQGTVFRARYRVGGGRANNVPADTLVHIDLAMTFVQAVTNPLPADNGLEPEAADEVRKLAPDAFREVTYRAVRPEDYAEAAERLDWVQRAGTRFRWTGSWLSAFTTPDPLNAATLSLARRREVEQQLDRFRQAGRESHVADPRFANIGLEITVCVAPDAYPGEVQEAVLDALFGTGGFRPQMGFFSPDNFTFGTPLRRSGLEAAIQAVPGVRAVETVRIRRRGWFDWRDFDELAYEVGVDEIVRVENDPLYPERGSLKLIMEGGA